MYCLYSPTPSKESTQIILFYQSVLFYAFALPTYKQGNVVALSLRIPLVLALHPQMDRMETSRALGHVFEAENHCTDAICTFS